MVRGLGLLVLFAALGGAAFGAEEGKPSPLATTGPRPKAIEAPTVAAIEKAIARGVDFLLKDQNRNGSWGSATQTKDLNIYAPVPGAHHAFRAAVTSLAVMALIESGDKRPEVAEAIDRGEAWMLERLGSLRRATGQAIYNVWGHSYSISAFVRLHERLPSNDPRREAIRKEIARQIDLLARYASVDGGWGYYDFRAQTARPSSSSISFTTATALVAMDEARRIGIDAPRSTVEKAVASIQRQRKPDFSYIYGEYLKFHPMAGINRPAASLGRSQACNLALRLAGDGKVTDEVLVAWLDRLVARDGWLSIGRKKPVPHESFFAVSGYFYYYGYYYAGHCVLLVPEKERTRLQGHLAHILLKLQEKDGSWWDYPLYNYHQQYGTAFAIMTLARCRPSAKPGLVP